MDSSAQPLETTSALRLQAKTGSHLFKIFGYSQTKGIGTGAYYRSGVFTIGGYDWVIEYYPDGSTHPDYVGFSLRLRSQATDLKARVTLTILQQDGVPSDMSLSVVKTFSSAGGYYYYSVNRSKFEASGCLKDDAFTVKCDVSVLYGFILEVTDPNGVTITPLK